MERKIKKTAQTSRASRFIKILYIEPDLNEIEATDQLESVTTTISKPCTFTVVPNCFVGMEHIQFTKYDMIFVNEQVNQLTGRELMRCLRRVNINIPFIHVMGRCVTSTSEGQLKLNFENYNPNDFAAILYVPFSAHDLCKAVQEVAQLDVNAFNLSKSKTHGPVHTVPFDASQVSAQSNAQSKLQQPELSQLKSITKPTKPKKKFLKSIDSKEFKFIDPTTDACKDNIKSDEKEVFPVDMYDICDDSADSPLIVFTTNTTENDLMSTTSAHVLYTDSSLHEAMLMQQDHESSEYDSIVAVNFEHIYRVMSQGLDPSNCLEEYKSSSVVMAENKDT